MRALLLSAFFLLFSFCLAAQEPAGTEWHYFYKPNQAVAAARTQTAIWFSIRDYLVKIDQATQQVEYIPSPLGKNRITAQLWVDEENNLFPVTFNYVALPEGVEWSVEFVEVENLYLIEKLVHRQANGEFLFLGSGIIDVFRWRPGTTPVAAIDLQEATPWRMENILWDPLRQGYWASDEDELGWIVDGVFTPINLPALSGDIHELHLDRDQQLWVRTQQYLLKYTDGDWLTYPLPPVLNPSTIAFATLGNGAALLVDTEHQLLLKSSDMEFQVWDYSDVLSTVVPSSPFLFDNDGTLWWTDVTDGVIKSWQEGKEVEFHYVDFWLPFSGKIGSLTNDNNGRIWLNGNFESYYYADHRWWKGEQLYPGFPDSTKQISFNSECAPVVIRSSDFSPYNFGGELFLYYKGTWQALPDDRIAQPSLENAIPYLRFDRNDHLLMQRGFQTDFQIWAYQRWSSFLTTDFFPLPSNIYDIAIDDQGNVYIFTDLGIFFRSGQYYKLFPPETIGEDFILAFNGRLRFSPEGTLWIMLNRQLIRWQGENGQQISFTPDLEDPLQPLSFFNFFIDLIVFSDKNSWLISNSFGVVNYDGTTMTHYHTENSGLPTDIIYHLAKDDRERIWMASDDVLAVMTPPTSSAPPLPEEQIITNEPYLFPNPACCQTQLSWEQIAPGKTTLQLYNQQGQLLRTILDTELPEGKHTATIQRNDLPAGIYFLILDQNGACQTKKLLWE